MLPSISPGVNAIVGLVVVAPGFNTAEPCAVKKPLANAITVYDPAGAVRLNVPSGFAVTEVMSVVPENKLTVTGFDAVTVPVSVPFGRGVGEASGVEVNVGRGVKDGVGDSTGVNVSVGVGDSAGGRVRVGVAEPAGGEVSVGVGDPAGSVVDVAEGVTPGGSVAVGVADSAGGGVNVAVGPLPVTVRFVPVEGRLVSEPFP